MFVQFLFAASSMGVLYFLSQFFARRRKNSLAAALEVKELKKDNPPPAQEPVFDTIDECNAEIAKKPDASLYYRRAVLFYAQGKLEDAYEDCSKAILYQQDARYYFLRAQCNFHSHKGLALEDLIAAIKLDSHNVRYHAQFAILNNLLALYKVSLLSINKAISLNPTEMSFYLVRTEAYCGLERFDEALGDLERVLANEQRDAELYKKRAEVYKKIQRVPEAIADYIKANSLSPANHCYHDGLGQLYYQINDLQNALSCYDMAIELIKKSAEQSLEVKSDKAAYYYLRGKIQLLLSRYELAECDFREAKTLLPYIKKYSDLYTLAQNRSTAVRVNELTGKALGYMKQSEPAKNQELFIVMGDTGSGKSTLINYLAGKKMRPCHNNRIEVDGDELTKIGHSVDSETPYPIVVKDPSSPYIFLDCPGFRDTRNITESLAAAMAMEHAIGLTKTIKGFLLTVTYQSLMADSRNLAIREIAQIISHLINSLNALDSSVVLVITQVPQQEKERAAEKSLQHIDCLIESYKKKIGFFEARGLKSRELHVLEVLRANRIIIANLLDKGQTREELFNQLPNLNPINQDNFGMAFNDELSDEFKYNLIYKIALDGLRFFKASDIDEISNNLERFKLLDQMRPKLQFESELLNEFFEFWDAYNNTNVMNKEEVQRETMRL